INSFLPEPINRQEASFMKPLTGCHPRAACRRSVPEYEDDVTIYAAFFTLGPDGHGLLTRTLFHQLSFEQLACGALRNILDKLDSLRTLEISKTLAAKLDDFLLGNLLTLPRHDKRLHLFAVEFVRDSDRCSVPYFRMLI